MDFGTGSPGALINGVQFDAYNNAANGTLNFNRTASSGTLDEHGGNGTHNVSGSLANLMTDMYYNGANTPGGTTTWTLSGLTAGQIYDTRIYTRQWGVSSRTVTFVFDPDGAGPISDSTGVINEDDATTVGFTNANDAYYINYQFTAVAGEDMVITLTQENDNQSWHLYGLSNEQAGPQFTAYQPTPNDGSLYSNTFVSLQWKSGDTAASHDVYFSASYDDVANGDAGALVGNTTNKFFVVGFSPYPYPEGLVPGTTYYWRIDEVEADEVTKHAGRIWSFSIPSNKAHDPNPVDGMNFVDLEPTLTWTTGHGAMIHVVHFGDDYDTVANAAEIDGEIAPDTSYTPTGPLESGKTYYWRVDESNPPAQKYFKGDVWSFTTIPEIPITDPNLIGWWKLDEGMGTIALDWSGHENHGIISNPSGGLGPDGSVWYEDPDNGTVLSINGDDATGGYVNAGTIQAMNLTNGFTWSFWARQSGDGTGVNKLIFGNRYGGTASPLQFIKFTPTNFEYYNDGTTMFIDYDDIPGDVWIHHAVVKNGTSLVYYRNGIAVGSNTVTATIDPNPLYIAGEAAGERWRGLIYNVRIYDKALMPDQVKETMRSDPRQAWDPAPANAAVTDIRDTTAISWGAGDFASSHDVYWGASMSAVENADTASPEYMGRQASTSYSLAGLIEFGGGPYYWRIDEINTDSTVTKGRVWSFSVANYFVIEDVEDYNDEPPDRVFETWIDGFGGNSNGSIAGYPYPVFADGEHFCETTIVHGGKQSMPFFYNNNMKYSEITKTLVSPNRDWTQHDVKTLSMWYYGHIQSQGSFVEGPAGTYTITGAGSDIWDLGTAGNYGDEFHYAWKNLNAGTVEIIAKVSAPMGENMNEWAKAGVMIRETLEPNSVHAFMCLSNTQGVAFQYRAETGGASTNVQLAGVSERPQWLRLTKDISGNFTAYHANDVGGAPGPWTQVGTQNIQMDTPCFIGLAITSHTAGVTASAEFSNITTSATVTGAMWTHQDIGIQSSDPERMYVKIRDNTGQEATVYNPDLLVANVTEWTEWGQYGQGIALSEFTTANPSLNLANIDSISLGFGTFGNTTQPGGSGLVFFDDLRLYQSRCVPELGKPANDYSNNCVVDMPDLEILTDNWLISDWQVSPVAPSTSGLTAYYQFQNNLADSSGNGHTGDPCGTTVGYAAGQTGQALNLDGTAYVNVGNVGITGAAPRTIAGWAKASVPADSIAAWTNVFGFTGASASGRHFDIQAVGDTTTTSQGYYGLHVYNLQANLTPIDQDWHHLAGTYDGTTVRGYADGHQAVSADGTLDTEGILQIGKRGDLNNMWSGLVDEVRVYSRALSQAEIASLAGKTAAFTQDIGLLLTPQDGNMDTNGDGVINFADYAGLIDTWLDEQFWP